MLPCPPRPSDTSSAPKCECRDSIQIGFRLCGAAGGRGLFHSVDIDDTDASECSKASICTEQCVAFAARDHRDRDLAFEVREVREARDAIDVRLR